jgi:hypothetical protein
MDAMLKMDPLVRLHDRTPAEVCSKLELTEESVKLLESPVTPSQFMTGLIQARSFVDAVKYLAHALNTEDAIMWAGLCVRSGLGEAVSKPISDALMAAEACLNQSNEANQRLAEAAAAKLNNDKSGAEFVGLAAFWSGGNMAPEGLPPVETPPGLVATAASCAVMLAATNGEPEKTAERYKTFLSRGILIARTPRKL